MRAVAFASRNFKEIFRDRLTLFFGVVLPIIIMYLFTVMQKNMPFDLYTIEMLTPGVIVFSFSFLTLFSGMLISKDKSSSFLMRIFASPMTASDYMYGYTLPLLPVAGLQILCCFLFAIILGLSFSVHVLVAVLVLVIIATLYIGFGLLLGSFFTDKQVGGIFAIFVNLSTWFSGTFFELDMIGGTFQTIGYVLPFVHSVDLTRFALAGDYRAIVEPLLLVVGYAVVIFAIATVGFRRKMRS